MEVDNIKAKVFASENGFSVDAQYSADSLVHGRKVDGPYADAINGMKLEYSGDGNLGAVYSQEERVKWVKIEETYEDLILMINLSAAQSRIQDADYAIEVSNMMRA